MQPINAAELITEEVADKSAEAAQELIKQAGWDIVAEMGRALAEGINATALVIYPISVNLEKYKALLTDPEGFEAKYNTLRKDVKNISQALVGLYEHHEGKKGTPTEAELSLVNGLTLGYTKVQGHLEQAIHPLMLNIVADLEAVGITELTIEEKKDA
ncbi:hypothetical protein ST201phi2-1p137 [Pseudomonas phage 201phi2-1]|uniref:Uncharacterized protein n=1 Tax=Pseudomonas phage 201phi2-1 TaxID=198110 RepID=B3FJ00_BP201|nr:hypothetical protein ST201phi2-1p137 [Pseudomonas phage 201phi2-1]ABY62968.1 hypothetical protein 201phi2-1p137 [Pseudomonas phage 201phi2-1]